MILETLRLVKNALSDGTIGVNAMLSGIPRDGTDTVPANVALIAESTSNFSAAIDGLLPDQNDQYPCLMVCPAPGGGDLDAEVKAGPLRDASIEVFIRYGNKEADAAKANRDANYTLRAVLKSLRLLQEQTETSREMNGIYFFYYESWSWVPYWQETDGKTVTTGLRVRLRMRDTLP